MFDAIFCPTDLTEASATAYATALRLATLADADLRTVHIEGGPPAWEDWPDADALLAAWGELTPQGFRSEHLHTTNLHISAEDPHHALLGQIRLFRPDLLVLRTHGRAGLDRLLARNVAEPLIRASRVPALVLPDDSRPLVDVATGKIQIRRALLPVADEPSPHTARERAIELFEQTGQTPIVQEVYVGDHADAPFRTGAPPKGLSWETAAVDAPSVVAGILDQAVKIDADLIVMGSRGRDSPLDAIFGSTAEQVLRKAHCPVLVVPA